MNINGHTEICGLIGNPVKHTLSPLIHNTLSELCGKNLVYVPFQVENGKLQDAIRGADALNLLGLNVTVPYKSDVIAELKDIDGLAKNIGAVNTLVRVEGGYKGYNTDMTGLYRAMQSDGIEIEGKDIVILGAGGAARAVAFLCISKGAERIYLLNRTYEKAAAITKEIREKTGQDRIVPMLLADYEKLSGKDYIVIQATSVGLSPNCEDVVISDENFYKKIKWGYDLIYKPSQTRFMKLVEENGGRAFNGLKMLLYQGIIAYELWNDVSISQEQAQTVYDALKEACYEQ